MKFRISFVFLVAVLMGFALTARGQTHGAYTKQSVKKASSNTLLKQYPTLKQKFTARMHQAMRDGSETELKAVMESRSQLVFIKDEINRRTSTLFSDGMATTGMPHWPCYRPGARMSNISCNPMGQRGVFHKIGLILLKEGYWERLTKAKFEKDSDAARAVAKRFRELSKKFYPKANPYGK